MTLSYEEAKSRIRKSSQRSMQLLYRERKDTAYSKYGRKCRVCGSTDQTNLQIVPKRGFRWTLERCGRLLTGGHDKMRWLDQNDYPDDFTLVCRGRICWGRLQVLDC